MTPVRVVHARVQSEAPIFHQQYGEFVSPHGAEVFEEGYRAGMDGVNTASVEGALMYVQAEGINYNTRAESLRCERKNNMRYIVFYELMIAQTNETLALYQDSADQSEYGPMIPMDQGRCSPSGTTVSGEAILPKECYYFNGDKGEPNVGPFVGGESKEQDIRAPYPDNYWFSFPNTCPLEVWANKTPECRLKTRRGLCDHRVMPDGLTCTFTYQILGYVAIDDVVGITRLSSPTTGRLYANFTEFCRDGGVEFKGSQDGVWESGLEFWAYPQDQGQNAARARHLIDMYQNLTRGRLIVGTPLVSQSLVERMAPLPSISELSQSNPPCYKNVKKCAMGFGCRRETYSQLCRVCKTDLEGCQAPPPGFVFPTLSKAVGTSGGTGSANKTSKSDHHDGGTRKADGQSAALGCSRSVGGIVLGTLTLLPLLL